MKWLSKNLPNGAKMKVKICGITNIDDALLCCEYGADAIGFIFYEKSMRHISFDQAKSISEKLPPFVFKAGVFVNEETEKINHAAKQIGLNVVQLHGDETPEYIENISVPVIKSFRINEVFEWDIINAYKDCYLLLDTFSASEMGGTGKSFDWKSIPEKLRSRIILSGGITIDKLDFIFNKIKPAAIDLSSSLESSPGKKDKRKVIEFLKRFNELRSNQC